MTKGEASRLRTQAAIIDGAAKLLTTRGEAAGMDEIAASAGISRATLYRYFPSREDLLNAMAAASVQELATRIAEANLDSASFDEAVARLARAILATGGKFAALSADSATYSKTYPDFDARVTEPMRALFRRGFADGSLRQDLPAEVQLDLFSGLIRAALDTTTTGRGGIEDTAAAVSSMFLHGARAS
ncbi:TetR/AcrR family transcriptional regulator [Rathayibacter sp. CAU 1779]